MSVDNIARLSRRLLATPLKERGEVVFFSQDYRKQIETLPEAVRNDAAEFLAFVRASIPTDFSFSVTFDFRGVAISCDFEDGNTGSFGMGPSARFTSFKSLRKSIRQVPWDDCRKEAIEQGGIFDEMLEQAADRPPNIPSSSEAAEKHSDAIASLLKEVQAASPFPPFVLVIGRDDYGISGEEAPNRYELIGKIADRMTTQNDILAVIESGLLWSFPEIEAAKLEAVEELGPISRAKAERRFY